MDFLFFGGVASIGLILVLTFLLPPIQYLSQRASLWFDATIFHHHAAWFGRLATASHENEQYRSNHQFLHWLQTRVNGELDGDQVDHQLVQAQKLTPLLRYLIQEEIPSSIRRCNSVHLRMALASGVTHMREISYESECLGLRRWMSHLLSNTDALLQQYPLNLRIETDDLLSASIVVRKSLLPTCRVCPYVQRSVAAVGERCPAAELIQLEVKRR
ncbi:MAG TPA: hypothetical protein VNX18_05355 [Bryobacteraceae bacterium]|nr:hypothetical protein [Bryobacteraceae bacterium]